MSKIERLTNKQERAMALFAKEWIDHGLSTSPADRVNAELGVCEAYEAAGLTPPTRIVWCTSPMAGALTRAIVLNLSKNPQASVGASVGASVRTSVGASVRTSVGASVGASVRTSVGASVGAACYGQHDSNWLAFCDYFARVCGLTAQTSKLNGLWRIAKSANWWWPHQGIAWISERHNIVRLDERNRLHNPNGPAVQYPDGWGIWAWNGLRVARELIEEPIRIEQIENEHNAEIRRMMIERYGQDRYLIDSGAEQLHQDEVGTLYRKNIPGDEPLVMVKVRNSTPEPDGTAKDYFLRVPPQIQTAREAVAWSFEMKASEYHPKFES